MNIIIFAIKKLNNKPFTNAKPKIPCKALSRPCDYFGAPVLSWKCQFSSLLLRISKILASESLDVYLGLNLQYLSSLVWQCVEKVRRNNTLIILESEEVDWAFLNLSTRFPCNTEISLHFFYFLCYFWQPREIFLHNAANISFRLFILYFIQFYSHIQMAICEFFFNALKLIVWLKKVNT